MGPTSRGNIQSESALQNSHKITPNSSQQQLTGDQREQTVAARKETFELGFLLQKAKENGKMGVDQITAKAYLDKKVFGILDQTIEQLLCTIEDNGEFEKYVEMLASRLEQEQRELRRRAREMRRIECGDEKQVSSDTEESPSRIGEVNSSDEETYGEESEGPGMFDPESPILKINEDSQERMGENNEESPLYSTSFLKTERSEESPALHPQKILTVTSKQNTIIASQMQIVEEAFNPLRFIGLLLKEMNEELKEATTKFRVNWKKETQNEKNGSSNDSDYFSRQIYSTEIKFANDTVNDKTFELIDYYDDYYSGQYSGGSTCKKFITGNYKKTGHDFKLTCLRQRTVRTAQRKGDSEELADVMIEIEGKIDGDRLLFTRIEDYNTDEPIALNHMELE